MSLEVLSETNCFGGRIGFYRHASDVNNCDMQFSIFVPPQADTTGRCRLLTFLSGLTCTEENFMVKSGAQRVAAELGLMLVSRRIRAPGERVSPTTLTAITIWGSAPASTSIPPSRRGRSTTTCTTTSRRNSSRSSSITFRATGSGTV